MYLYICEAPTNDYVFAGENASTLNMNKHIMMKQLGNGLLCSWFKYFDA